MHAAQGERDTQHSLCLASIMGSLRATDLVLAAAVASLCCAVDGFTPPTAVVVGSNAACFRAAGGTSTAAAAIQPHQQQQQQRAHSRGLPSLRAVGGEDDGIEEYKRQMAEFMAEAHEKRLQAMEAVKKEVQRGYEEQIADLQSKVTTTRLQVKLHTRTTFVPT